MPDKAPNTPRLVIIGGAEDRSGSCTVLREFVARAGGPRARIVVIAVASEEPRVTGTQYGAVFQLLGASRVDLLDWRARDDAKCDTSMDLIEAASAVFFTGGTQARILSLLGGTPLDTALHRRVEQGMILGGTSAGAAVMSGVMILEGESSSPRAGSVSIGPGMEFLPGVIIDQHFGQRGRINRLLTAVAQFPHCIGIGIDEDTALFVEGHQALVLGSGAVTVIDAGNTSFNDAHTADGAANITLCGVTLHSLPHGRHFDLLERKPLLAGASA